MSKLLESNRKLSLEDFTWPLRQPPHIPSVKVTDPGGRWHEGIGWLQGVEVPPDDEVALSTSNQGLTSGAMGQLS